MMTKKEFSKTVKIYKSHPVKNGFISITYATVLAPYTVSTEETVCIENKGGALTSLYFKCFPEAAAKHAEDIKKQAMAIGMCGGPVNYMDYVKERILKLDGGNGDISIVGKFDIKDGTLFQFDFDGEKAAVIVYNDGTLFQQADWQSGCPESISEIDNFEWLTENRQDTVMFDGLPRTL